MRSIAGLSCCLAATAVAAGRIPAFAWSGSRWVAFAGSRRIRCPSRSFIPPSSYLSANYGYVHEEVPAATLVGDQYEFHIVLDMASTPRTLSFLVDGQTHIAVPNLPEAVHPFVCSGRAYEICQISQLFT